jgi:hypothetical protein
VPEKRAFSEDNIPTKAVDYHGTARYVRTQPDVAAVGVKSINIDMTFKEAMKMSLAIHACLIQLNRYNRRNTAGREMGMLLSLKTDSKTITVIEKRVLREEKV